MNVVFDIAVHPVDRRGEERAQNEREHHPVLDEDVGGQREEIEADVLVVERIVCAIWHLIDKPQEDAPVADFCGGDKQSEQSCPACDQPGPRQSIAYKRKQIWRRVAREVPRRSGDKLCRPPSGKTQCEPSVQPKYDGGSGPDRKKDGSFGADCCPKNLQITDRGKPQPGDQEVAREPEQDQANPNDDGRNNEPDHGTLPWYLPFGSGNPDRHGLIIAEMRDVRRLIRGRDCASRRAAQVLETASPGPRSSAKWQIEMAQAGWLRLEADPRHQQEGTDCHKENARPVRPDPQESHAAPCRLQSIASRPTKRSPPNSSAYHVQDSAKNEQSAKSHQHHSRLHNSSLP